MGQGCLLIVGNHCLPCVRKAEQQPVGMDTAFLKDCKADMIKHCLEVHYTPH